MNDFQERLKDISEIRSMMERSSRFISLSGLSGVSAGAIALMGALGAYFYLVNTGIYGNITRPYYQMPDQAFLVMLGIAVLILVCAVGAASFFSIRLARKRGEKIWNQAAGRVTVNLLIPLVAGAIFCLSLAYNGFVKMVAPATLIFYGLALINASKFTLSELRYLGISEVLLGLIAAFSTGFGIFFWATGFGLLHMVYGVWMYVKHER